MRNGGDNGVTMLILKHLLLKNLNHIIFLEIWIINIKKMGRNGLLF